MINSKMGRTWKKAVVILLEVLFRHFAGGTEKNRENPQSGYLVFEP
jgi:hypothetical protein